MKLVFIGALVKFCHKMSIYMINMIMFLFCLLGFFGIVITGIIGHFVYDALCRNKWIAWGGVEYK